MVRSTPRSRRGADQCTTWRSAEVGGGGFVTGTVFHPTSPGLVYARTDVGGIYRLENSTQRWVPLNDEIGGINNEFQHLGVLSIALDPNDPKRLYIATGQYGGSETWKLPSRIYRSTDCGASWLPFVTPGFKMAGNGEARGTGERMVVDPLNGANLLVGTSGQGIWRSSDHGATWTRVTQFTQTSCNFLIYAHPSAANPGPQRRVYAAANTLSGASFWRSDDNGSTWSEVPMHPGKSIGAEMMPLHGSFDAAGVFYSTWGDQTGPTNFQTRSQVWKLSADATTWTQIQPPAGQGGFSGISADPRVPGHIVTTTIHRWWPRDEVYRSTNGGATWTAALTTAARSNGNSPWAASVTPHWMTDIDIDPFNSDRAIFNTGFGLFQSTNLAATGSTRLWTFFNDGLEELVPLGLHSPTAGPPLISVTGDYTGFRHDRLDRSPLRGRHQPGNGSNSIITGADLAPTKMIRQNSSATYFSQDAAATWQTFPTSPPPVINGHNRAIFSTNGQRVLWCPPNSPAYFSTNQGLTWSPSIGSNSLSTNEIPNITTLAGALGTAGTTNATGGSARFNTPSAICLDASGTRYIADTGNHAIRRIVANAGVNTFVGTAGLSGTTDATGSAARFNAPSGVATGPSNTVFVADTGNHTIRKITSAGAVTTLAGSPGLTGSTDATTTAARFHSPVGITSDSAGNLYICDAGNHTIRKITASGVVTTLAGSPGLTGTNNGTGSAARFNNPRGIAIDSSGTLYIADTGNHCIRKISTTGEVTTFSGTPGTGGSTDSPALFRSPAGITINTAGTLHVADTGNHTLRRISPAGSVTTIAGGVGISGTTNASGTSARFNSPSGIASDASGFNLYIADATNHGIRRATAYNTLFPIADRVDPLRFYLWDSTLKRILSSADGGENFSVIATGLNSAFTQFRSVPGHNGHLWARAGASGLHRSTNFGASFTKISAVSEVHQFDFGKAAPGASHPAIFIWGKIGTNTGFFRSDDTGASWTRINDNSHNFGYQNDIAGDPRVHGRLYLATSGRGIIIGEIANPPAPPSQVSQVIFDDALASGWTHTSPSDTSLTSTSPVRRGSHAIAIPAGSGKLFSITTPARSLEGFAAFAFWIHAGESNPPPLQIGISRGGIALEAIPINTPATVGWQRVIIPFTDLGISNISDLTGIRIESRVVNNSTPVAFSIDDLEWVGADEFSLPPGSAIITLSNLETIYDGTQKSPSITTIPPGVPVSITYNGSPTLPSAAGSYTVHATVDDPSLTGSATGTLVIAKAAATILLGDLTPAADGTQKSPSVTTIPPGLAVSLSYNGSATAPSKAGSYSVLATITDTNHTGSTNASLIIRQLALATTDIRDWTSNIAAKVTTQPEFPSSPRFTPNDTTDAYSTNTLQAHFTPITLANPGDQIILTGSFQLSSAGTSGQSNWFRFGLFDNRGQAPNIATDWLGHTCMGTSLYERTAPGLFSTGSGATQRGPDATPTPLSSTSPTGSPPLSFEVTVTRTESGSILTHRVERTDTSTVLIRYSHTDTSPNNNGLLTGASTTSTGYNPTFTTAGFAFSRGYIGTSNAIAQFSNIKIRFIPGLTVEPQFITFPTPADRAVNSPAFDLSATASSGLPVSFTVLSGPAILNGSSLTLTGTGTVVIRASQAGNANHLAAPGVEQSFAVTKAPATVTLTDLTAPYTGAAISLAATTSPTPLTLSYTYNGSSTQPTSPGIYQVDATIVDSIYQGSASATLTITKAPQEITFTQPAGRTFGDAAFDLSATATSALPLSFSIVSGPGSISGSTLTIEGAGTILVRASQSGNGNFLAAPPVDQALDVAKAAASINFTSLDVPYDGQAKPVLVTTSPPNLATVITYDGSPNAPLAPGTYAIIATVTDPNYTGSASADLVIGNRGFTRDLTAWIPTSATMADANTASPLWNPDNLNAGIAGSAHALFPPIQLSEIGDSLKLTGTVAIQVNSTSRPNNNRGLWFRFGLFRNQSPVTQASDPTTNWLGYCGMINSSSTLYERTSTGNYASSITGSSARTPQISQSGANSSQNSISIRFTETLTRTANGIDVTFHAINTASSATLMSFTHSDTTPNNNGLLTGSQTSPTTPIHSPTFSAAGFVMSGEYIGTSNASAQFSNVQVSYSSPSPGSSQSIDFTPIPDRIYGAPAVELAATASSGLPVTYSLVSGQATLTDNTLTPIGIGEITIRASQTGNLDFLPATPVEQTFTIQKAPASVILSGLNHTHDGTAKSATVTTDPAGKLVDLRYDGEQSAPQEVGSYEVSAIVIDDSYEGAASGTLVISPAQTALEQWRFTHFETYENAGDALDLADPDFDGITNLMEFALALDPRKGSTSPTTLSLNGNLIQYTYTRSKTAATELNFIIEHTENLLDSTWTAADAEQIAPPLSQSETLETITTTLAQGSNRLFIRLKVTPKNP